MLAIIFVLSFWEIREKLVSRATVLATKNDSDIMFVYKVVRDL